ncbi:hypothetical protein HWV62_9759 [Athelia sp. TMB]|nr:hypothetical protein HWV62_9759 [Athelia sp. TMB]
MESQVTLVDPVILTFDSFSVRNARISLSTNPSTTLYTVSTIPNPTAGQASYIRTGEQVVATVQVNDVLPDKVTFYEADGTKEKVSCNKWLKKGTLPDDWQPRAVHEPSRFLLLLEIESQVSLYNSSDPEHPVVTYTAGRYIALTILSEREILLAHVLEVLVAFLFLEGKMRIVEQRNAGSGKFSGMFDYMASSAATSFTG